MLDGHHFGAIRKGAEIKAARDGAAVHEHRAASAHALPAAFARAHQVELTLENLDQIVVRLDLRRHLIAIERECDTRHRAASNGRFCISRRARSTLSGVSGSSRTRAPQASSIAFAMAGEAQNVPLSPTPLAPNGPFDCAVQTASFSIRAGTSRREGILYSASDALVTCPASICIFSNMVNPSCITDAPEICVSTIFGFTGRPQSTALMRRRMRTAPVSVSTS